MAGGTPPRRWRAGGVVVGGAWVIRHVTVFELLDRLCTFHADLKTDQGWGLVAGNGKRAFVPPEDARHPRHGPPGGTGPPHPPPPVHRPPPAPSAPPRLAAGSGSAPATPSPGRSQPAPPSDHPRLL